MSDEGGIVEGQFRELPDIPDKEPLPPLPATVGGMIGGTGGGNAITNKSEGRSVEQQSPTQASDRFLKSEELTNSTKWDTIAAGSGVFMTGLIGMAFGASAITAHFDVLGLALFTAGAGLLSTGAALTGRIIKRTEQSLKKP